MNFVILNHNFGTERGNGAIVTHTFLVIRYLTHGFNSNW